MTTLSGTLTLQRAVLSEVVEDPNVVPRVVVAGTAASAMGGQGQAKVDETGQAGEFRQYGNGNTRLILGSATSRVQNLALLWLTPDQVQIVRDLLGHTVCYRDNYGRKVFGAFLDIQVSAVPFSGNITDGTLRQNVALSIQSVTYDEAV